MNKYFSIFSQMLGWKLRQSEYWTGFHWYYFSDGFRRFIKNFKKKNKSRRWNQDRLKKGKKFLYGKGIFPEYLKPQICNINILWENISGWYTRLRNKHKQRPIAYSCSSIFLKVSRVLRVSNEWHSQQYNQLLFSWLKWCWGRKASGSLTNGGGFMSCLSS